VFPIFLGLGYPRLLSLEMTRICTRAPALSELASDGRFRGKAPYALVTEGRLPQGSPTSGALANLVMVEVDAALTELARSMGLTYTRYSDDLTFSSGPDFSRDRATTLLEEASSILGRNRFWLQRNKTRVAPPGSRHVVLGLMLSDRVGLLPRYKRRLETHVRGVARFGLSEHARFRRFNSVLSFVNHVDGLIAFAASVEPAFAQRVATDWHTALAASGFPNER
jgi:hypothetical protein